MKIAGIDPKSLSSEVLLVLPRGDGQIVFRAKGKIVNLILMIPGDGIPKALMLALATYTISKPINSLKDPT